MIYGVRTDQNFELGDRPVAADDLAEAATGAFHQHADSEILLSFPGLGPMLSARVLAELGDDRARFAITRASGKKRFVGRRFVKNNRLINASFLWTFAALTASPPHRLTASPGANAHYRRRREHGDWHAAAQRHLLNRFLGQLHHCLKARQHFDEQHAFAPLLSAPASSASPTDFSGENNGASTEARCEARTQSKGVAGVRRPSH